MVVISRAQMVALEARAQSRGESERTLMEAAAEAVTNQIVSYFVTPITTHVLAGRGHNGGDALAVAILLRERGWPVTVELTSPEDELKPLTREFWDEWCRESTSLVTLTHPLAPWMIIDGVNGLGQSGPLSERTRAACRWINEQRKTAGAYVVALDGPTGLDLETGEADVEAVRADMTIAIAAVKTGCLADGALDYVGRLAIAEVAALNPAEVVEKTESLVATEAVLRRAVADPLNFSRHKGEAGRVVIIAGSLGYTGAARLCAEAAIRAGVGLVTLWVTPEIYIVVAAAVPPEVMVRPWRSVEELRVSCQYARAVALGPGLGRLGPEREQEMLTMIASLEVPLVIDADALMYVAEAEEAVREKILTAARVITPHPGEMKRLWESLDSTMISASRTQQAQHWQQKYATTLVLKGSRTITATAGEPLIYNTTGHPGMATGGMGDVLTGIIAALLARGVAPHLAGATASWLIGRAAEIALMTGADSPESLRPTSVLKHLGNAFRSLRDI